MSYKNELLGRVMFEVTDSEHINEVLDHLTLNNHIIESVEYHSNGSFVIQYLSRKSAEMIETITNGEKTEQAIINSLVRDCSKALTNTVSEDVYCKVVNYNSGEVSKELSSSFFKRWYRDIQSIKRAEGCFEVELKSDEVYALSRL